MPPRKRKPPHGPAHERLGKRIRELRERTGKSQRDLETDFMSYNYLSEIESGRATPAVEIIDYLTHELPTWGAELHSLLTDAILERNRLREKRQRFRREHDGIKFVPNPPEPLKYGMPVVEVLGSRGEAIDAPVVDVAPDMVDVTGPFVIEEIDEHVIVSARRTFEVTTLRRKLRATEDGLHSFSYMMEEDSTSPLSRISFRVVEPATVSRVLRISRTHYVFDMTWPEPLREGENIELKFSIHTDNYTSEPIGLFIKQQMVPTDYIDLTVEFKDIEPALVWRIDVPAPSMIMAFPEFPFDDQMILEPTATGAYNRRFTKTLMPGRMVGIAWKFSS